MQKFKHFDLGLLILRIGIGLSMALFHGFGKISGGVEAWAKIGSNMSLLGITLWPAFFGFMAAFAEFVGSILIVLGFGFRSACTLLAITMFVASYKHLSMPPDAAGAGWKGASHALEFLTVYVALFFTGPGKFALDEKFQLFFKKK